MKPLDPPSVQRLRNVEIAFRIDGNTVRAGDAPQLVAARAAELRQFLSRDSIEDSNELVAEIADVHVLLVSITREGERPGCAVARIGRPEENRRGNISLEGACLVEDLDAIAVAVAHVQQAVIPHHDAMHDVHERAAHARGGVGRRALAPPLPQELAGLIEDHDALVAVAVGDEHVAVHRVHGDLGRRIERDRARVQEAGFQPCRPRSRPCP